MIDRIAAASGGPVSRETFEQLERFVALLLEENRQQNLISPNSAAEIWDRHILDGAQLLALAGAGGRWCDIGSGPGLPGMIIAILGGRPMTLIEPRRLRAEFLRRATESLGLADVDIAECRVEQVRGQFDLITARAVAPLERLLRMAAHLAASGTRWVLPKGERAKSELDEALKYWQGNFRLVPSQTHEGAAIIVAEQVRRKGK